MLYPTPNQNGVVISFEQITPKLAAQLLLKNTSNRPIRQSNLDEIKRSLLTDSFKLNGDTIRFDKNNRLLDGQHRLIAVIETGISINAILVTGLPPESFDTIDIGAARTPADILSIQREKNATTLASALADVWRYKNSKTLAKIALPKDFMLEFLAEHPELRRSVALCSHKARRLIPPGVLCGYHYLFSRVNTEAADAFVYALDTGTNLSSKDPVYHLRERLMQYSLTSPNSSGRSEMPRIIKIALLIKAFNAHIKQREISLIRWGQSEAFPEIVDLPPSAV